MLISGVPVMKVVVFESPAFLGFVLRKMFKIKKEEKKD